MIRRINKHRSRYRNRYGDDLNNYNKYIQAVITNISFGETLDHLCEIEEYGGNTNLDDFLACKEIECKVPKYCHGGDILLFLNSKVDVSYANRVIKEINTAFENGQLAEIVVLLYVMNMKV